MKIKKILIVLLIQVFIANILILAVSALPPGNPCRCEGGCDLAKVGECTCNPPGATCGGGVTQTDWRIQCKNTDTCDDWDAGSCGPLQDPYQECGTGSY